MKISSFQHLSRKSKRPFGVMVIIFMIALYVLLLALSIFPYFAVELPHGELALWILETNNPSAIIILFSAIILLEASIAIGLWRLERWAWILIMVQSGIIMASDLLGIFSGYPSYATMLVNVIIVFYLNQHEIQRVFSGFSGTSRWAQNAG